jgi:ring-1,2-phenylacetyl-CoA epoxidase subunit PaaD
MVSVAEDRLRTLLDRAGEVPDPELPVLSLAELGVLRGLHESAPGRIEVELTPTYTGCPAIEAMAADIESALRGEEGVTDVTVRTVLSPAWSTDDITSEGRRKLAEFGIAPPRSTRERAAGPVTVGLSPTRLADGTPAGEGTPAGDAPAGTFAETTDQPVHCPHCGSTATSLLSRFSSTACKALRRCDACSEPFDHFKEL